MQIPIECPRAAVSVGGDEELYVGAHLYIIYIYKYLGNNNNNNNATVITIAAAFEKNVTSRQREI